MRFTFAPIRRADFQLLSDWLSTPHVLRWWSDDPSLAAIEADYGGCVDGTEAAEVFIASCAGEAIGLVQRYRFEAYPEYMAEVAAVQHLPPQATGIDYLIGPQRALSRGLGTDMIADFVQRIWLDDPVTPAIIVPVQAGNRASWRALERVGFVRVAEGELTPDNPADSTSHYIYRLARRSSPTLA